MYIVEPFGYLPGDAGLILFTEDIPKGARVIIPVVTEEEGKIALTEWLERFLHKDAEYRKRYLIDTGRGYVLNWKQLDEDHVVLMATIRKFGTEFKEEGALCRLSVAQACLSHSTDETCTYVIVGEESVERALAFYGEMLDHLEIGEYKVEEEGLLKITPSEFEEIAEKLTERQLSILNSIKIRSKSSTALTLYQPNSPEQESWLGRAGLSCLLNNLIVSILTLWGLATGSPSDVFIIAIMFFKKALRPYVNQQKTY